DTDQPKQFALIMITTVAITTLVWLAVTYLTAPEPQEKLLEFYRRTRPSRRGWAPIAALAPEVRVASGGLSNLIDWIAGCTLVYGVLFGVGKLLLGDTTTGLLLLAVGGRVPSQRSTGPRWNVLASGELLNERRRKTPDVAGSRPASFGILRCPPAFQ